MNNLTCSNKLSPIFETTNTATIISSCSNVFVPYLCTCLQSLKNHTKSEHNYDIIICETEISEINKKKLKGFIEASNISLRFLSINEDVFPINLNQICNNTHFSKETFFRILMPGLIPNFNKVLYIDADTVIMDDVYDLFSIDLEGNTIGCCKDAIMNGWIKKEKYMYEHLINNLHLKNINKYFQAGVMIFDCEKYRKNNCEKELLELMKVTKMETADQCLLNKYFNNDVKIFDFAWNYENECTSHKKSGWVKAMDENTYQQYLKARQNPKIIHYVGPEKPWKSLDEDFADIWWQYARQTPYYEIILYNTIINKIKENIQLEKDFVKNTFNYKKCKFLAKYTLGRAKKHYNEKAERLKNKIEEFEKLHKL